jgi:dTDP-4-amino-4,6-dideoxygalactose transaminase
MRFPYSSPNFRIIDFLRIIFLTKAKAENKLMEYFKGITGKKYIIVTNSCRSALYLAYSTIGKTGEVITSPLTCKVAIDPIIESGNKAVFTDISLTDLNINTDDIEHRITENTLAIQVIHLGGNSCDMDEITRIAKKNKLWIIEDCAQSFGAIYNNNYCGSFGDISCYSLIKNAYGIGGGVFATDSLTIYNEALKLNNALKKSSGKLIAFRIVRNLIDTKRKYNIGRFLYKLLMNLKGTHSNYKTVIDQLRKISSFELKISFHQISRVDNLHQKRKSIGIKFFQKLVSDGILQNDGFTIEKSSFTKFYIYNPVINSKLNLKYLNNRGIEAMHLENKYHSPYQDRIVSTELAIKTGLNNYNKVHDCLISLPLVEYFTDKDLTKICNIIKTEITSKPKNN